MEDHVRGSILVVDDEPTIAEVVARYLNRAGYEVSGHRGNGPSTRAPRRAGSDSSCST